MPCAVLHTDFAVDRHSSCGSKSMYYFIGARIPMRHVFCFVIPEKC